MKRVLRETVKQTVDLTTGEVVQETHSNVLQLPQEPPFVKLYVDDISKLHGLSSGSSALLFELVRRMDYEGVITLISHNKESIAKAIGVKLQTVNNSINLLLKANILRRYSRGAYVLNPNLFAKGDWYTVCKKREKYLELAITYKEVGGKPQRSVTSRLKPTK